MKIETIKQKEKIAQEAVDNGNVKEVAEKYSVGVSTLYKWISLYIKMDGTNQVYEFGINFNKTEYDKLEALLKETGFQNNRNAFIKKRIFGEKMLMIDPKILIQELFGVRASLNKIGSNVNQIANYFNYLGQNKMVDESKNADFFEKADEVISKQIELKAILEQIFRKEF